MSQAFDSCGDPLTSLSRMKARPSHLGHTARLPSAAVTQPITLRASIICPRGPLTSLTVLLAPPPAQASPNLGEETPQVKMRRGCLSQ